MQGRCNDGGWMLHNLLRVLYMCIRTCIMFRAMLQCCYCRRGSIYFYDIMASGGGGRFECFRLTARKATMALVIRIGASLPAGSRAQRPAPKNTRIILLLLYYL